MPGNEMSKVTSNAYCEFAMYWDDESFPVCLKIVPLPIESTWLGKTSEERPRVDGRIVLSINLAKTSHPPFDFYKLNDQNGGKSLTQSPAAYKTLYQPPFE